MKNITPYPKTRTKQDRRCCMNQNPKGVKNAYLGTRERPNTLKSEIWKNRLISVRRPIGNTSFYRLVSQIEKEMKYPLGAHPVAPKSLQLSDSAASRISLLKEFETKQKTTWARTQVRPSTQRHMGAPPCAPNSFPSPKSLPKLEFEIEIA